MSDLVKPLNTIANGIVNGAGAFLSKICLPAAEEYGLLLQDKVKTWRSNNFEKIALRAEEKLENSSDIENPKLHPRVLSAIYESGSWTDDAFMTDIWAGILASSCENQVATDKNVIYVDILSKMSSSQARMLEFFCKETSWKISEAEGLVESLPIFPDIGSLKAISGQESFEEIDESLSHMQYLGLIRREAYPTNVKGDPNYNRHTDYNDKDIEASHNNWVSSIEINITSLGCRLYLKAKGISKKPTEVVRNSGHISL